MVHYSRFYWSVTMNEREVNYEKKTFCIDFFVAHHLLHFAVGVAFVLLLVRFYWQLCSFFLLTFTCRFIIQLCYHCDYVLLHRVPIKLFMLYGISLFGVGFQLVVCLFLVCWLLDMFIEEESECYRKMNFKKGKEKQIDNWFKCYLFNLSFSVPQQLHSLSSICISQSQITWW